MILLFLGAAGVFVLDKPQIFLGINESLELALELVLVVADGVELFLDMLLQLRINAVEAVPGILYHIRKLVQGAVGVHEGGSVDLFSVAPGLKDQLVIFLPGSAAGLVLACLGKLILLHHVIHAVIQILEQIHHAHFVDDHLALAALIGFSLGK